jgi:hypothetical protein
LPEFEVTMGRRQDGSLRVTHVTAGSPAGAAVQAYLEMYGEAPDVIDLRPLHVADDDDPLLVVAFGEEHERVVARVRPTG